jgi:hypothetical protein
VELETFFLHGCNGWSVLDKELVMVLKMVLRGLMLAVGVTVAAFSGQHADAAVVNLTVSPSSIAFTGSSPTINPVFLSGGVLPLSFSQYNDNTGKDFVPSAGGLSFAEVADGTPITAALSFNAGLSISPSESGDKFYAFKFSDGGLDYFGWIKESLGGSGGTINILAAAYQSVSGDPIFAGQTAGGGGAVPEPATAAIFGLATLVAGARGFKARRKAQAAS